MVSKKSYESVFRENICQLNLAIQRVYSVNQAMLHMNWTKYIVSTRHILRSSVVGCWDCLSNTETFSDIWSMYVYVCLGAHTSTCAYLWVLKISSLNGITVQQLEKSV